MRSCNDIRRKTTPAPRSVCGRPRTGRGAVGTLAMDLLLYARYRRGGGQQHLFAWEFSSGLSSWDEAAGTRASRQAPVRRALPEKTPAATGRTGQQHHHWAYGMLNGALYGIAAESLGQPRTWYGLPFGAGVWAVDYAGPPGRRLYKPIQDYDPRHPGQGPHRPPRLRDHHRRRPAAGRREMYGTAAAWAPAAEESGQIRNSRPRLTRARHRA